MARRSHKSASRRPRLGRWLPLVAAYAAGLACAACGVLVLAYGQAEPLTGEEAVRGSTARLGIGLALLGILALALTGYLHWARRQR